MKPAIPFLLFPFLFAPLPLGCQAPTSYAAEGTPALQQGIPDAEGNLDLSASGLETHAMSGPNGATASFSYIGTKLFYAFHLPDNTPNPDKERLAFSASFGSYNALIQGNFAPWFTGALCQMEIVYDDVALAYDVLLGVDTGSELAPGTSVAFEVTYQDAETADTAWGGGVTNSLSLTLAVPVPLSTTIPEVSGTNHLMRLASDWAAVPAHPVTGVNAGTLKVATIGTRLFFRLDVPDATPYPNADKISYELTYAGKHHGQQGNFAPWLTGLGTMDFGENVQTELSYDAAGASYAASIGIDLGSDYLGGSSLTLALTFVDVTEASAGWGEGTANSVSLTLDLPKNGLERWTEAILSLPCDPSGAPLGLESWDEAKAIAQSMDGLQREPLSTKEAAVDGTDLERALSRYDYVIGKYNTLSTTVYADYLGRVEGGKITLKSQTLPGTLEKAAPSPWSYILATLGLGFTAGAVLLVCKKRKKD